MKYLAKGEIGNLTNADSIRKNTYAAIQARVPFCNIYGRVNKKGSEAGIACPAFPAIL